MELIKININEKMEQVVSARDLHERLEVKKDFSDWIKTYTDNDVYGFEDGIDYTTFKGNSTKSTPRPRIEYILKLDMAKQLCMMSKVEKGREYRKYLMEVEKAWNDPSQIMARALQIANNTIDNCKVEIKQQLLRTRMGIFL